MASLAQRSKEAMYIFIALAAMLILLTYAINEWGVLDGMILHGSSVYDACAEMYLGDNWTKGYHNKTVWQCDSEVIVPE